MSKALIAVFSQSGNTRKAAEIAKTIMVQKGFSVETYSILHPEKPLPEDWDFLVLASPLYFEIEPLAVRIFLQNLPVFPGRKSIILTTYADQKKKKPDWKMISNIELFLKQKGITAAGSAGMICNDSSDILMRIGYGKDRPNELDREQFAKNVSDLIDLPDSKISLMNQKSGNFRARNELTYRILPTIQVRHSNCVRCGICVRKCPLHNLKIEKRLIIGNQCMKCYACENSCPKQAIRPDWRFLEWVYKLPSKYGKRSASHP